MSVNPYTKVKIIAADGSQLFEGVVIERLVHIDDNGIDERVTVHRYTRKYRDTAGNRGRAIPRKTNNRRKIAK